MGLAPDPNERTPCPAAEFRPSRRAWCAPAVARREYAKRATSAATRNALPVWAGRASAFSPISCSAEMFAEPFGRRAARPRELTEIGIEMPARDHDQPLRLERTLVGGEREIGDGDRITERDDQKNRCR